MKLSFINPWLLCAHCLPLWGQHSRWLVSTDQFTLESVHLTQWRVISWIPISRCACFARPSISFGSLTRRRLWSCGCLDGKWWWCPMTFDLGKRWGSNVFWIWILCVLGVSVCMPSQVLCGQQTQKLVQEPDWLDTDSNPEAHQQVAGLNQSRGLIEKLDTLFNSTNFHGWDLLSSLRNWIETWLAANCQGSTLLSVSAMTLSIADVNRAFKAARVSWTRLGSADCHQNTRVSHQNTRVSVGCFAGDCLASLI